ncbi:hypothetical protein [Streptomyces sp. NPDC006477]|uniref:hypothetical protein n=1 Tax=Streptomyces sp. NPDC006477 TaxID=3364747 RepID=UPI0036A9A792
MNKYDPQVVFRPAFDDGELYLHEREFTLEKDAKNFAAELNRKEVGRFRNGKPDVVWFVLKCTTRFAEGWKPKPTSDGTGVRRTRVVKKATSK